MLPASLHDFFFSMRYAVLLKVSAPVDFLAILAITKWKMWDELTLRLHSFKRLFENVKAYELFWTVKIHKY